MSFAPNLVKSIAPIIIATKRKTVRYISALNPQDASPVILFTGCKYLSPHSSLPKKVETIDENLSISQTASEMIMMIIPVFSCL